MTMTNKLEKQIKELRRLAAQPTPPPLRTKAQVFDWMHGLVVEGFAQVKQATPPNTVKFDTLPNDIMPKLTANSKIAEIAAAYGVDSRTVFRWMAQGVRAYVPQEVAAHLLKQRNPSPQALEAVAAILKNELQTPS